MAALYEEKKKGSLLHFCSDEKSIDEVERVSKYNGYPHAGNAYYYIFSRKKTVCCVRCYCGASNFLNEIIGCVYKIDNSFRPRLPGCCANSVGPGHSVWNCLVCLRVPGWGLQVRSHAKLGWFGQQLYLHGARTSRRAVGRLQTADFERR